MVAPFLTAICDQTDGCAKHDCCASDIYLLSCLAIEFSIIVDIAVETPRHGQIWLMK